MSLNLHQKLIEIRKTCSYLKKDNKGYQFNYVSSSQALGTLRGAMDEHGVLLVPAVISSKVTETTNSKGNKEYFTELNMLFTWVNSETPEQKIDCQFYCQGVDNAEKGVGKALTYGEKYFLLKFFNIATDQDDPDSFQGKVDAARPYNPAPEIAKLQNCQTEQAIGEWWKALSPVAKNSVEVKSAGAKRKQEILAAQQQQPEHPELLTDKQRIAIQATYNGMEKEERLRLISLIINRELDSVNNLTKQEANLVLDSTTRENK